MIPQQREAAAAETITLEHSDEHGTKVTIDDPHPLELVALALVLVVVVLVAGFWIRLRRPAA